jgi:proteasome lid subunit RPN8/RPN11
VSRGTVRLRPGVRRAIVDHARRDEPHECCGFLVGRGRDVLFAAAMKNAAESPVVYRIDDRAHIDLRRALRSLSPPLEILGVYHSHPRGPATPSETDRKSAFYPDWIYLIVGLGRLGASRPRIAAFRLRHGRATRVPLR